MCTWSLESLGPLMTEVRCQDTDMGALSMQRLLQDICLLNVSSPPTSTEAGRCSFNTSTTSDVSDTGRSK